MQKLLGYIPLQKEEDYTAIAKETDVIKIEGEWFKLTEVWIPGVATKTVKLGSCREVEIKQT